MLQIKKQQQEQFESYKNLQEVRNDLRKQITTSFGYHFKEFLSLNEKTYFNLFANKKIELFMENNRKKKIEFSLVDQRFPSFFKELEIYVEKKYPQKLYHISYDQEKPFQRRKITIQKLTEEKKEQLEAAQKEQIAQPVFEDYEVLNYNFRSIIDEIITQKTPLIVHNGFTDILQVIIFFSQYTKQKFEYVFKQLYDKFLYNLPEGSSEFKREINKYFPTILDTKLIINATQQLSQEVSHQTDLRNCFEKLLKYKDIDTKIVISDDIETDLKNQENEVDDQKLGLFSNYQINGLKETNKIHEAGYDALMTGYILNIFQKYGTPLFSPSIDFFQNRLPLYSLQQSFDIKEIDQSDTKSVDVFYIKQLNSTTPQNQGLQDFFNQQLGSCKVYTIGNSIEQEYYVTSNDKSKFKYFESKLNSEYNGVDVFQFDGRYFQIKTYEKYIQDLNKIVKDFKLIIIFIFKEDKTVKVKNMDSALDQLNQE